MPKQSRSDAIRGYFAAFKSGDRTHLERALAEDFTFTSPYDDAIDRAAFFERCWPNSDLIKQQEIETIIEEGERAFVLYRAVTRENKEFRNAEFFTFRGDKIVSVQVFFGPAYQDGRFVRKT